MLVFILPYVIDDDFFYYAVLPCTVTSTNSLLIDKKYSLLADSFTRRDEST